MVAAVLTAFDVSAQRGGAAGLDRRHDLELAEADVPGMGCAPGGPVLAEDVGDLECRAVGRTALSRLGWLPLRSGP